MSILATLAFTLAAVLAQGFEQSPFIVALLALLALPGATSLVVSVIRKASDATGADPRVIVYLVSLVVTGVLIVTGAVDLPDWTADNPAGYVQAWIAWGTVNAELARRVYELLLEKIPVLSAPA